MATVADNTFWDRTDGVRDGDGRVFGRFTRRASTSSDTGWHSVTEHRGAALPQDQSGRSTGRCPICSGRWSSRSHWGRVPIQAGLADRGRTSHQGTSPVQAIRSMKAPGTAARQQRAGQDPSRRRWPTMSRPTRTTAASTSARRLPTRAFYLVATAIGGNAWAAPGPDLVCRVDGPRYRRRRLRHLRQAHSGGGLLFGARVVAGPGGHRGLDGGSGVLSATGSSAIPPGRSGSRAAGGRRSGEPVERTDEDSVVAVSHRRSLVGRTLSRRVAAVAVAVRMSAWRDVLNDDRFAELFEPRPLEDHIPTGSAMASPVTSPGSM